MKKGTIVRILRDKGYGFIHVEGGDKDIFFHMRELQGSVDFNDLKEGDTLNFEVTNGEKGPQAANVSRV